MAKAKKKTTKKRAKAKAKPEKTPTLQQELRALLSQVSKLLPRIRDKKPEYWRPQRPEVDAVKYRPGYHKAYSILRDAIDKAVAAAMPEIAKACPSLTAGDLALLVDDFDVQLRGREVLDGIVLGVADRFETKAGKGLQIGRLFAAAGRSTPKKAAKKKAPKKRAKAAAKKASTKKTAKAPKKAAKKAAAKPAAKTGTAAKKPRRSVADRVLEVLDEAGEALTSSQIRALIGNVAGNRLAAALAQLVSESKLHPLPGGRYQPHLKPFTGDAADDQDELDELDDHVCDDDEQPEPESGQLSVVEG